MAAPKSSRTPSGGCLGLFFLPFLAAGVGLLVAFTVLPALRSFDARDWEPTPCTILSSRVAEHAGDDGSTYSVEIEFRYEFRGRSYRSDRYGFFRAATSGRRGKQEIVDRHPPGSRATCFVNPGEPAEAVIEPKVTRDTLWGLLGLPFALIGIGGVYYAWFHLPRKRRLQDKVAISSQASRSAGGATGLPPDAVAAASSGSVTLRPQAGRLAKLISALVFSLIWNGVISLFAINALRDGSVVFLLFLSPFVLVGIGSLGVVVYFGLAALNPRVVLTLSAGGARPGETLSLTWGIEGRRDALTRVEIHLVGREEATYRRGTDTVTDRAPFAERLVLLLDDPTDIRGTGQAEVHIPHGSMHTFVAPNNKVLWLLRVRGRIPRWPDVVEEYPIVVLPHEVTPHE